MAEAAGHSADLPWMREPHEPRRPDRLSGLADEILSRCRGEGPANCVARCPLRVDARGYVQLTQQGRFREALQLVRERLPFPGILGYICDHPCELHCKRMDEDSAVRIREIKRFLAEWEPGEPQHLLDTEPERTEKVAVVGAGPAGLLAAHDLARRGYRVTIYEREAEIGGCLVHKIPEWRLPRRVVERDLSLVEDLGIRIRTGLRVGADRELDRLRAERDCVILLPGYEGALELLRGEPGYRRTVRGTLWADPLTCETELPGVFAGGEAVSGPTTVVNALALGRRAAESAHRFLRGRGLRDDREAPGPRELLWSLDIDEAERQRRERTPVMLQPCGDGLSEARARKEAERCLDCSCRLCVDDCEFLARHCDSPKELARRVTDGLEDRETLDAVYSCNLCSLCAVVCPEGLDTGELLAEARRRAVQLGAAPLPAHRGALDYQRAGYSKTFSLLLSEPGRGKSRRLFFPGCALPAVAPRETLEIYDRLRRSSPGTGVLMFCCGAPARQLGQEERFRGHLDTIERMAASVGAEELVTACPDCMHTLGGELNGLRVTSMWEPLAASWKPPRRQAGVKVSLHDPCKARQAPALRAAVRRMLELCGCEVEELEYSGELTRCCGSGGLIRNVDPELYGRIVRRRAGESDHPIVTYCASCRMALRDAGKPAIHLVDFLLARDWESSMRRPYPGTVKRYANRLWTKWKFRGLRPFGSE